MEKRTSKELAKNEHPSDVVLFLLFIHRAFLQDWYWYPCWLVSGLFASYVHHDKRVSVWKFWCLVMYRCAWLELILKPAIYSIYAVSIFCWNCWDIWDRIESVISENIEIFLKYDRYIADRDCAALPPADGNYREGKQKSNENQFKMMIDFDCLESWCGITPPQKSLMFQIRFVGSFSESGSSGWDTVWTIIIHSWGLHHYLWWWRIIASIIIINWYWFSNAE